MKKELALVDRGRGLQLSTSRITVQDLVPYFQRGCSYEEIMRWMPTLNRDEIALVEKYYSEHKNELDEEDRDVDGDQPRHCRREPGRGVELVRLRSGECHETVR